MFSFLLGFILFGVDLAVLFYIAKKIIEKESKKNFSILFILKFIILFLLLWIIITVVQPQMLIFVLGAFFSLISATFFLFLWNKNN